MTVDYDTYLMLVFVLANSINILSAMMFLARVNWPDTAAIWGMLAILMGIPALALAITGVKSGIPVLSWLMPLLYAVFALLALLLDYVLKVEFRQPRRAAILFPFLLLFFVSLIGMWGMLWDLGFTYWALTGVTYFAMVGTSFYALGRGVG